MECLLTKYIRNRYEPRRRDGGDGGGSGKVVGRAAAAKVHGHRVVEGGGEASYDA